MKKQKKLVSLWVIFGLLAGGFSPAFTPVVGAPQQHLSPQSLLKKDSPFVFRGRHIFLDETARFVRLGKNFRKVYAAHTIDLRQHESPSVKYFARSGDLLIDIEAHLTPEFEDPYFAKTYLAYSETLDLEFQVAPFAEDLWLIERIGKGEMGIVYKAWDAENKKFVAVKVSNQYQLDQMNRFAREARQLAELDHPNVVKVLSLDESEVAYFVMEMLDGKTFFDLKEENPDLPLHQILEMTIQVAEGLQYFHERGIVHRDIKPDNLMWVNDRGKKRAVIIDLGLLLHRDHQRITPYGHPVGSPIYMSPEQVLGRSDETELQVDARSDIYSLGAVLFTLLAGKPSHAGTTSEVFVQKLDPQRGSSRKHLTLYRPDLPPEIVKIVYRAMAHKPEDRFQSAREFKEALQRAKKHLPTDEIPVEEFLFEPEFFDAAI